MTESSGSLEGRVDALEARVEELAERLQQTKQDATAARVLAGGADRDVEQVRGEVRDFRQVTVAGFNATRDDLTDLRIQMNSGFTEMRTGFGEMRGRLDVTAAGLTQIVNLLSRRTGERGDERRST